MTSASLPGQPRRRPPLRVGDLVELNEPLPPFGLQAGSRGRLLSSVGRWGLWQVRFLNGETVIVRSRKLRPLLRVVGGAATGASTSLPPGHG